MKSVIFEKPHEAVQAIAKSENAFVLFSSPETVHELSKDVKENTVLCSVAGEYGGRGYQSGIISGFEYDPAIAQIVPIEAIPAMSKDALKKAYEKVKTNPNAFLFLLCDGLSSMEEKIITSLYFLDNKFKVIGGSAGDDLSFTETPIYIGSERVHSLGMFFDCKSKTHLIKENIYKPSGKELLVTEAEPMKRIVKSFNGKPASTEYARLLGVPESDLQNHFMNRPLGMVYGDEVYIASPQKINSDKSISFYCQIIPNSFVKILEPLEPQEIVKQTLSAIPFRPHFVLAINCILRSLKFQEEGLWPIIDRSILGFCSNTTGFVSYGEQFYQRHVNQTMVLLAIE
ncbi:MAG: hypothetical protein PWQ12_1332 [Clostridiales bacterium]|jgi:hypothetical protein|nr:hypothetical protein [Clostridiales bacterium]